VGGGGERGREKEEGEMVGGGRRIRGGTEGGGGEMRGRTRRMEVSKGETPSPVKTVGKKKGRGLPAAKIDALRIGVREPE